MEVSHDHYNVRPLAKQKHLPFSLNQTATQQTFEIINCGIWGAYYTPSLDDCHYFLNLVDDYTKFTWVELIESNFNQDRMR